MATLEQQIEARARVIQQDVRAKFKLNREISNSYALITAAIEILLGQQPPEIVSGLRTPARQRRLFEQWKRGDPRVRFQPARRSWHMLGRAFDLQSGNPTFEAFRVGWQAIEGQTGRDGASFGDLGHFDRPGDRLPPAAF